MNKNIRSLALATVTLALASCTRTPVPQIRPTDVPPDWMGPVDATADVWPNTDWWTNFGSEELVEIIEFVKANNFSYQTTLRNLEQAQITLREAGYQLWPTPNISISTNASTTESQIGDVSNSSGGSGPFRLNASASYGSILSKPLSHESSLNNYESQKAQHSNTALNTLGTAASTYFQLLFLRDQIRQSEANLETAREVLDFTQARVDAGVEIPINLYNQQISVLQAENSLRSLRQTDFQTRASLALLTGRGVRGFDIEGQTLEGIVVPSVQPGLPSELLTRRPDLVQQEISLQNAAINVDNARLAFLPSISLSGSAGSSSAALINAISDPAQTTFSLSASLSQTLLDNGGRKRRVRTAELQLETALANYRQAVIQAFNDIEQQLNNIDQLKATGEVTLQQRDLAEEQFRLANLRYEQGTANYQTVLTAQNTLFSARNSVLSNRQSQLNAIITFYQALGGGWEAGELLLEQPEYAISN
jgi:NodT family efflux transporter outer membrane factor (OMF) lipoprotein